MLKSSPEQEAALEQLLAEQQDPISGHYHQWLTPEQFGERFGASQQDITVITGWLQRHGFRIDNVAKGRREIEFGGTARQVENTFHTEIRRYDLDGERHIANATDILIPEALTPVVEGVASLNDFSPKPILKTTYRPQVSFNDGRHAMTPYDFATIYNVAPLWNEGFDGTGQTIAIVGRSSINLDDVATFRANAGLPTNDPEIILNGPDPGILSDREEGEALLDVEWSGAVATGATIKLVVTGNTNATPGIFGSAQYIVDNAIGSVVSVSFGGCEALSTPNAQLFWNNKWQQAAAQGMSVFVSSGDSGSANCDDRNRDSPTATGGLGVSAIASTAYNVAVGGTQFNENGADSVYWNNSSDRSNFSSVKVYIPEIVWNESAAVGGNGLWSGGGGVSLLWTTPSWQTGYGVPTVDPGTVNGHHRYLPDVSLTAAGHDGYVIAILPQQNGSVRFSIAAGTSAAAPAFAGIMAIVNQVSNQANGNPNPRLYALAAQRYQDVFHDITQGSNTVPCVPGSPNCIDGMMAGYDAHPGYDLATGFGSVDAYNLAHFWAVPTGTIMASPNPCTITSGTTCTTTISWSTQNVSSAEVRLLANGDTELSFAGGISGSASVPWISAGIQYQFRLYNIDTGELLSSVTVTGVYPSGRIAATPNPCTITSGTTCTSTITWSTQGVGSAEVRLQVNGGTEVSFAGGTSGSESAPWITAGNQHKFNLYNLDAGTLLSSVTVTANTPPAHLTLSGNTSWQQSGNTVTIDVDRVSNSGSFTSGSIRLELWAFSTPYAGQSIAGYLLASYQFPQALGPNQYYSGITQTVPFTTPSAGSYYTSLLLEEYTGSNWVTRDYVTYSSTNSWGIILGPTLTSVSPASANTGTTVTVTLTGTNFVVGRTTSRF